MDVVFKSYPGLYCIIITLQNSWLHMLRHTFPALLQNFVSNNSGTREKTFEKSSIWYPIWYLLVNAIYLYILSKCYRVGNVWQYSLNEINTVHCTHIYFLFLPIIKLLNPIVL